MPRGIPLSRSSAQPRRSRAVRRWYLHHPIIHANSHETAVLGSMASLSTSTPLVATFHGHSTMRLPAGADGSVRSRATPTSSPTGAPSASARGRPASLANRG
jgi:hypothetical protein